MIARVLARVAVFAVAIGRFLMAQRDGTLVEPNARAREDNRLRLAPAGDSGIRLVGFTLTARPRPRGNVASIGAGDLHGVEAAGSDRLYAGDDHVCSGHRRSAVPGLSDGGHAWS